MREENGRERMNNNISNFLDDDFKRALINHCKTFKNYEYKND